MIRSGIIEEVEDGDQDVQHITALEHKEEEFLEGGSERVGRVRGETPLPHPLPIPGAFPEAAPSPGLARVAAPHRRAHHGPPGWQPTLLKSQSFQKRTSSSWWNWIFLVELGR